MSKLSNRKNYRICLSCPNCASLEEPHCVYGLQSNKNDVVYVALPQTPFWNFMASHSNNKSPLRLPDKASNFSATRMNVTGQEQTVYIHKSLYDDSLEMYKILWSMDFDDDRFGNCIVFATNRYYRKKGLLCVDSFEGDDSKYFVLPAKHYLVNRIKYLAQTTRVWSPNLRAFRMRYVRDENGKLVEEYTHYSCFLKMYARRICIMLAVVGVAIALYFTFSKYR